MTKVHSPPNTHPITEIFAVVSVDAGGEGIIAGFLAGAWVPMVTSEDYIAEIFRQQAPEIARTTNRKLRLVRFTTRETLQEFDKPGTQK